MIQRKILLIQILEYGKKIVKKEYVRYHRKKSIPVASKRDLYGLEVYADILLFLDSRL